MNTGNERAQIINSQLIKARESIGLSRKEAANRLNVDEVTLDSWEKGANYPDAETLYDIAVTYKRPVAYFFEVTLDEPAPIDLRVGPGISPGIMSYKMGEAIRQFEAYCESQWELEVILGKIVSVDIGSASLDDNVEVLSAKIKQKIGYPGGHRNSFARLRQILNKHGIKVFGLLIAEEIDGAAWWHGEYGPSILINLRAAIQRRLFTLAHEYSHLMLLSQENMEVPILCNLNDQHKIERFCSQFAASFLIPSDEFKTYLLDNNLNKPDFYNFDILWQIASYFKVSRDVIAIRLEEMRKVPQGFYQEAKKQWPELPQYYHGRKKEWKRKKEDFLGNYYTKLALEAFNSGRLTSAALARHMDLRHTQLTELLKSTSETI